MKAALVKKWKNLEHGEGKLEEEIYELRKKIARLEQYCESSNRLIKTLKAQLSANRNKHMRAVHYKRSKLSSYES